MVYTYTCMGSHDIQIRNDDEQKRNDFKAFCARYGYSYNEGVALLVEFFEENKETFSQQKRRLEKRRGVSEDPTK